MVVTFRKQLAALIERMSRFKGLGVEAEFDKKLAAVTLDNAAQSDTTQASTGKAAGTSVAHDARVSVHEPLTTKFGKLATENPILAVILAYSEIEAILRQRLRSVSASGVDGLSGEQLIDVALSQGEIGPVSAEAVRRSLELRDLAARVGPEYINPARAFQYLDQSHKIITNIETWPRNADGTLVDPN